MRDFLTYGSTPAATPPTARWAKSQLGPDLVPAVPATHKVQARTRTSDVDRLAEIKTLLEASTQKTPAQLGTHSLLYATQLPDRRDDTLFRNQKDSKMCYIYSLVSALGFLVNKNLIKETLPERVKVMIYFMTNALGYRKYSREQFYLTLSQFTAEYMTQSDENYKKNKPFEGGTISPAWRVFADWGVHLQTTHMINLEKGFRCETLTTLVNEKAQGWSCCIIGFQYIDREGGHYICCCREDRESEYSALNSELQVSDGKKLFTDLWIDNLEDSEYDPATFDTTKNKVVELLYIFSDA